MTPSRAHTSAKAADVAKLLLLKKRRIIHLPLRIIAVTPSNRNSNRKLTLTIQRNVTRITAVSSASHVPPFH